MLSMNSCSKLYFSSLSIALLCGFFSGAVSATQNGVTSYPIGVDTVLNGLVPAVGQSYLYSYSQFYTASELNDSDGKDSVPGFKLSAFAQAFKVAHTWGSSGNYTIGSFAVVTALSLSLHAAGDKDRDTGLGDTIVSPLILGYQNPERGLFAYLSPVEFSLPTGNYSKNSLANVGAERYAYMPNIDATWLSGNWELSSSVVFEVPFRSRSSDYKSGRSVNVDYLLGYSLSQDWQVGLQGYSFRQVSDDRLEDERFFDGYRGKANASGPQVRYTIKPGVAIVAKYQKEFSVENRPEGDKFWV
ncbi:putative MetA-pathway of phenol degradation [compost metagenome]